MTPKPDEGIQYPFMCCIRIDCGKVTETSQHLSPAGHAASEKSTHDRTLVVRHDSISNSIHHRRTHLRAVLTVRCTRRMMNVLDF